MARTRIAAGNWKMNLSANQAVELAKAVGVAADSNPAVEVIIFPAYTLLAPARDGISGTAALLGGQNLYWEDKGAYTGEISGGMLADSGCTHVLVGHSERRQIFGETNATVNHRIRAALAAKLTPVVCVGETLEEREAERTREKITEQITGAYAGLSREQAEHTIVAYEPVWAIGTGKTASPEQAQEVHAMLRGWLAERYDDGIAAALRILYGGSVKPDNAKQLFAQEDIDGGLVGGASLVAADFAKIIELAG